METARACLEAGADFLTSPGLDPDIVQLGAERKVLVIPGASDAFGSDPRPQGRGAVDQDFSRVRWWAARLISKR